MRVNKRVDEIAILINQIEDQDDPRQGFALVLEGMARYQQEGDEVPEELVRVHRALQTDLILESQGR